MIGRRRFLAMATAWAVTMRVDPFRFGSESGGGEALLVKREVDFVATPTSDGGYFVPLEYAEEIAARMNAAALGYFEDEIKRMERDLVRGTGHGTPRGILHG